MPDVYEAASPDSYRITIRLQDNERLTMLARLDGKDYSNDSDGRDFEKDSKFPAGIGTFTIQWQRIDEHHQLLSSRKRPRIFQTRHIYFAGCQTADPATMGVWPQ
jgi:hypothetical protein